jgi:hypothetical protein
MMSRYNQPVSLENLALSSFAQNIKALGVKLLQSEGLRAEVSPSRTLHHSERESTCFKNMLKTVACRVHRLFMCHSSAWCLQSPITIKENPHYVQQICNDLQDHLHSMVIQTVANELTAELLQILSTLISSRGGLMCKPWYELVMQSLVRSIIHPAVTRLKLTHELYNIAPVVCATLGTMTNLEVLELSFVSDVSDLCMLVGVMDECLEQLVVTALRSLVNLKIFRFPCNCTDNIVMSVGCSCRYLKCIDFHCSKVTDLSVASILDLQCLLEVNLCRTSISEEGCTFLLKKLSQNNATLRSFRCSAILVSQLDILVSKFLNLTQVNLVSFSCDLSLLKELKNLQVLRLQSGHFSHVKAVLLVSGWHLSVLELARLIGVDVKVIGMKCSRLKNLILRGCNTLILENGGYSEPLRGFSSLHHLAIYTKSD